MYHHMWGLNMCMKGSPVSAKTSTFYDFRLLGSWLCLRQTSRCTDAAAQNLHAMISCLLGHMSLQADVNLF